MLFSKLADEKLKKAFDLYSEHYCNDLPTTEELQHITFSENFESNMQKLLKQQKKPYYYMINTISKKVAIIILALLITLTATTFSVKALREAVLEFIRELNFTTETFDTHTKITITDTDEPISKEFIKKQPQYVPNGFKIAETIDDAGTAYILIYEDDKNSIIDYSQYKNSGNPFSVDTESATNIETIYINSFEGLKYHNKGLNQIVFATTEYNFHLMSDISMEELINIANSIPLN